MHSRSLWLPPVEPHPTFGEWWETPGFSRPVFVMILTDGKRDIIAQNQQRSFMSQHILEKVSCPSCGSPIQLDQLTDKGEGAYIHCDACGSEFILRGHICPYCGAYHEQETAFCQQCGQTLIRRCPKCQKDNWIGNEYCLQCGAPLDILQLIVQRYNQGTAEHLDQQMESARALKEAEEAASRARQARLMEKERLRQEQIRRDLARRKAEEQKMYTYFLIGVIIIGILIAIVAILRSMGSEGAFPLPLDVPLLFDYVTI